MPRPRSRRMCLLLVLLASAGCPGPPANPPPPDISTPADLAEPADLAGLTGCRTDGGADWVNLATDPRHCGACDRRCCIATVCVNGQCVGDCNPGSQMCPAPMPDCMGGYYCAHLESDPNNCGACKQTCAPGQICAIGVCR